MSEPESSDPKNPQSASDATQRFAAGEPPSPYSTQQLNIPKLLAEGTLNKPLPELSVPLVQTQQLNVSQTLAESTLRMPLPELSVPAEQTQHLNVSQILAETTLKMPLPDLAVPTEQTQRFERPVLEESPLPLAVEPEPPQPQAAGFPWKLPLALLLLVLAGGGGATYLYLNRAPVHKAVPTRAETPEAVPEGARVYLDQAKAGDANAMRMLGAMFYNGLNVPQDREKGLYWYRQAAEKGSKAAKAELAQLEAARP